MWAAATVGDHSEGNAGYCGDLSSVWLVICYLKMAGATKLEVVFSVHTFTGEIMKCPVFGISVLLYCT